MKPLVPACQTLIHPSCQGGERLGESLQSSSSDSDSGEVEAAGEEGAAAGVRCSPSSDRAWPPRADPASSQGGERSAARRQTLGGRAWRVAGRLHGSGSLIGRCSCQWGPADRSYCGFLESHH